MDYNKYVNQFRKKNSFYVSIIKIHYFLFVFLVLPAKNSQREPHKAGKTHAKVPSRSTGRTAHRHVSGVSRRRRGNEPQTASTRNDPSTERSGPRAHPQRTNTSRAPRLLAPLSPSLRRRSGVHEGVRGANGRQGEETRLF